MADFTILRQAGTSHIEPRVAAQYAMTADVPIAAVPFESMADHEVALRQGAALPVGSVEFVRRAIALAGIAEPGNISYPEPLRPYLRRAVRRCAAGRVTGRQFVKPTTTKAFTGFVFDDPDLLSDHDREQYSAFLSLPPETQVWTSEPVTWLSEFRYYVIGNEVRGDGRYDDGPDDMPTPDIFLVGEMAAVMAQAPDAPAAFSIDVGVLDTGETALVECNDAWALGYYKGTLSHRDYIEMLWRRWEQLARIAGIC